jgi:hypothetical protein
MVTQEFLSSHERNCPTFQGFLRGAYFWIDEQVNVFFYLPLKALLGVYDAFFYFSYRFHFCVHGSELGIEVFSFLRTDSYFASEKYAGSLQLNLDVLSVCKILLLHCP